MPSLVEFPESSRVVFGVRVNHFLAFFIIKRTVPQHMISSLLVPSTIAILSIIRFHIIQPRTKTVSCEDLERLKIGFDEIVVHSICNIRKKECNSLPSDAPRPARQSGRHTRLR
ncbi:hypothetical protein EVAR_19574_1 [Eumeta japonica]|uniref:Uncharacterized protein n=1 Tax=Eumeta variegata TaxID=151549 RepID=A0A4C1UGP9_EUMVA|nr:hypothetical protein EVAR_19574_1 [Eumeta japonica]